MSNQHWKWIPLTNTKTWAIFFVLQYDMGLLTLKKVLFYHFYNGWNNHVVFRPIIRWYDIEANSELIQKLWKRLNKIQIRNLGTAINHSEMEEIKSVKLRDNLKIYQQQIGHMVTSLQMMRNLFFAFGNIVSAHRSICKKKSVTNRDGQFYFIYFHNLELNKQKLLHISCKDIFLIIKQTNSRLKLKRLFWQ